MSFFMLITMRQFLLSPSPEHPLHLLECSYKVKQFEFQNPFFETSDFSSPTQWPTNCPQWYLMQNYTQCSKFYKILHQSSWLNEVWSVCIDFYLYKLHEFQHKKPFQPHRARLKKNSKIVLPFQENVIGILSHFKNL